jgi:hypothetical protein
LIRHVVGELSEIASVQVYHLLSSGICRLALFTHHLAFTLRAESWGLMLELIVTVFIGLTLLRVVSRWRWIGFTLYILLEMSLITVKLLIEKVSVSLELILILLRRLIGRP